MTFFYSHPPSNLFCTSPVSYISLLGKAPKRFPISAEIPAASQGSSRAPQLEQHFGAGGTCSASSATAEHLLSPETKDNPKFQCACSEHRLLILFVIKFRSYGFFLQLFRKAPFKPAFSISWNQQLQLLCPSQTEECNLSLFFCLLKDLISHVLNFISQLEMVWQTHEV